MTQVPATETQGDISALVKILVAKSTPEEIQALLGDALIGKALGDSTPRTHPMVEDQWMGEKTRAATAEEVRVGPEQAASGGDAYRMAQQYSDNVVQRGIAKLAEELGAQLTRLDGMVKAITTENSIVKAVVLKLAAEQMLLKSATPAVVKAEDEDEKKFEKKDEDEKEDEKSAAILLDRADTLFKSAQDDIAMADVAKSQEAATGTRGLAKDKLDRAVKIAKAVAEDHDGNVRAARLAKSIATFMKAEGLLADEAAAPAVTEAAKAEAPVAASGITQEQYAAVMKGQAMLSTSINEMFKYVGRAAGNTPPPAALPALAKGGDADQFCIAKSAQINDMRDAGKLSEDEWQAAADIAQWERAVAKGKVPEQAFKARLDAAPDNVRALFADQVAA